MFGVIFAGGHRHGGRRGGGGEKEVPERNLRRCEATKVTPNINIGYNYPGCTTEELQHLDHAHEMKHPVQQWKPISADRAAAELEAMLARHPTAKQRDAIQRLKDAWTTKDWTPDIAIKSFQDFDRAYFGRYLKNRCRLRWKGSNKEMWKAMESDHKETYGVTLRDKAKPVPVERIILNASMIFLKAADGESTRKTTFETISHELIHAYLGIRCARNTREVGREDPSAPDPHHGRQFQRCKYALSKRTRGDIGFGVG
ncbi:hypothetical protein MMC30_003211 [Trapelia coarctata]|nr:hypothetical protein [Trapelia coarctata]